MQIEKNNNAGEEEATSIRYFKFGSTSEAGRGCLLDLVVAGYGELTSLLALERGPGSRKERRSLYQATLWS